MSKSLIKYKLYHTGYTERVHEILDYNLKEINEKIECLLEDNEIEKSQIKTIKKDLILKHELGKLINSIGYIYDYEEIYTYNINNNLGTKIHNELLKYTNEFEFELYSYIICTKEYKNQIKNILDLDFCYCPSNSYDYKETINITIDSQKYEIEIFFFDTESG